MHTRFALYFNASYLVKPKGHILFKDGDFGDSMYVIISGSVNVRKEVPNYYNIKENRLLTTLYDG